MENQREERRKPLKEERSMVQETISFIIYIGIVFLLTYLVIHYVGQRTQVSGTSMEYTLSDGDNLIVDKITYRFHKPERFDIVVFPFKHKEDTYYIKRIIGMPGETVQIDQNGVIYIDGEELEESYGREIIQDPGEAADPIELGADEYFVLGDNRNASSDSRDPSVGKVLGLMISNGLVALSGALLSQYQSFADSSMGKGAIVIGLAAVIIGEVLFSKFFTNFALKLLAVSIGAIIYYVVIQAVVSLSGIDTNYLKLISAAIVAAFLAIPYWKGRRFTRRTQKGGGAHA